MHDESFTTPEGFTLPRRLLLPDARAFSDVLEYVREWEHDFMSHTSGTIPRPDMVPAPRIIGGAGGQHGERRGNEIGPFCSIDLSQLDGPRHRSIAVRATDAVINAVRPRIVTPDDALSFRIIGHKDSGRALVVLNHGYIIGDHWLAYIDPATVPPYPFAARDRRVAELAQASRDNGKTPYRHRSPEPGVIRLSPSAGERHTYADVWPDGHTVELWPDGSETRTPAL